MTGELYAVGGGAPVPVSELLAAEYAEQAAAARQAHDEAIADRWNRGVDAQMNIEWVEGTWLRGTPAQRLSFAAALRGQERLQATGRQMYSRQPQDRWPY